MSSAIEEKQQQTTATAPPLESEVLLDTTNPPTTSIPAKSETSEAKEDKKDDDSMYECNICLDPAKNAVVSMCGHLFCWPCLHQWLEIRPSRKLCPVCKAAIDKDKVIPLYGRNSSKQEDPRDKLPPRPQGQRTEPENTFSGFGFGDGGFHMSFGIGAFPFGFFASTFNFGDQRNGAGAGAAAAAGNNTNRVNTQFESEQTLSKFFLYLALLFLAALFYS